MTVSGTPGTTAPSIQTTTSVGRTGEPPAAPTDPAPSGRSTPGDTRGGDTLCGGVRWGAVWAGTLCALPIFVVLQLLFLALGWLDLGVDATGQAVTASLVSAVLGLIAFFAGGWLAGSIVRGPDAASGLLHGVLMWTLGVFALFGLGLFGGGVLVGNLGIATALVTAPQGVSLIEAARAAAGWAALWLGASVVAAALGGRVGAKARPSR